MVENANNTTASVKIYGKNDRTEPNAAEVATTPSGDLTPYSIIDPSPLVTIITKAVIVHTTTVSINGSKSATRPSDAA